MKTQIFKKLALVLSLLAVVACGKKKDESGSVSGARDARVASGPSNLPTGQAALAGQAAGNVQNTNQQAFDQAVKALVSATVDPSTVGSIQRVALQGRVYVDRITGAVNSSASTVGLTIFDSNVGQTINNDPSQVIQPIQIIVGRGTGTAANYTANLTFSDDYGSITISGRYDQNNFTGTVRFANTKGSGFNGMMSGDLGTFSIPTCAFFVCQ